MHCGFVAVCLSFQCSRMCVKSPELNKNPLRVTYAARKSQFIASVYVRLICLTAAFHESGGGTE